MAFLAKNIQVPARRFVLFKMFLSTTVEYLATLPTLVLALFAFLLYYEAWIIYTRLFHPLAHVPGPFWASVSRIWLATQVWRGHVELVQRDLHNKLGNTWTLLTGILPWKFS